MSLPRWVSLDRTGFPYFVMPEIRLAVGVLPVTKAQAEVWLGDPAGPGDDWYADVLAVSPRAGWRAPARPPVPLWHFMLTGILPEEAERLAAWLGPDYRLPTAAEWRAIDRNLSALPAYAATKLASVIESDRVHPAAVGLIRRLEAAGRRTTAGLTLLDDGVLEWVTRPAPPHGALGRPAADLPARLILDPQAFDPVALVRPGRNPAFGARLVRTLPPPPAAADGGP